MPKSLDLGRLQKFEPASSRPNRRELREQQDLAKDQTDRWPSREPQMDGQISIKGPLNTIRRFRILCKDDRRTYADMLDILMNSFEKNNR